MAARRGPSQPIQAISSTGSTGSAGPVRPTLPDIDPDIFDFETLGVIYRWDVAKLRKVLTGFTNDVHDKLVALDVAHAKGDVEAIRHLAHALKGSAQSAGANRFGTLAANVENFVRDGNAEAVDMLVPLLAPTLAELRDAIAPFIVPNG
ncbi:hypothetical protein WCLP8_2050001 [uncultured Gammaproteobacteria bacterium]